MVPLAAHAAGQEDRVKPEHCGEPEADAGVEHAAGLEEEADL